MLSNHAPLQDGYVMCFKKHNSI